MTEKHENPTLVHKCLLLQNITWPPISSQERVWSWLWDSPTVASTSLPWSRDLKSFLQPSQILPDWLVHVAGLPLGPHLGDFGEKVAYPLNIWHGKRTCLPVTILESLPLQMWRTREPRWKSKLPGKLGKGFVPAKVWPPSCIILGESGGAWVVICPFLTTSPPHPQLEVWGTPESFCHKSSAAVATSDLRIFWI